MSSVVAGIRLGNAALFARRMIRERRCGTWLMVFATSVKPRFDRRSSSRQRSVTSGSAGSSTRPVAKRSSTRFTSLTA